MTQRKRPAKMRACGRPVCEEAGLSFPAVCVVACKLNPVDGLWLEATMLTGLQAYFNPQREGLRERHQLARMRLLDLVRKCADYGRQKAARCASTVNR